LTYAEYPHNIQNVGARNSVIMFEYVEFILSTLMRDDITVTSSTGLTELEPRRGSNDFWKKQVELKHFRFIFLLL